MKPQRDQRKNYQRNITKEVYERNIMQTFHQYKYC